MRRVVRSTADAPCLTLSCISLSRNVILRPIASRGAGVARLDVSVRLTVSTVAAVRWAALLPSERNGRVSGVWMVWVGRLRARASNCRRPSSSFFPECRYGLAGEFGILCCLPIERNPTVSLVPLRPMPSRVVGWTSGKPRVPGTLRPVAWLPRPTGCTARALGCGTLCVGVGSVGSVRPSNALVHRRERPSLPSRARGRPARRVSCGRRRREGMLPG